ncbi:hypothetical protein HYV86_05775 [Candidatus Woesearchaeota archaeon]|nr:hypothetical protein [Candidatus Woesearchaeota archaeon]
MPSGRPCKSEVRDRIATILFYLDTAYGYQVARIYNEIYPQVTQRLIYYHLWKGTQTSEFVVDDIKEEKGDYSWGSTVEKTYYSLAAGMNPKEDKKVEALLKQWKKESKEGELQPRSRSVFTRFADKFRKAK